ncbi:hypothetical protein TBS_29480 [Thermobispora bispora]|uniref:Integral membrane protein n=1 Tax=Thermobispora bispora (strain ATCC 19993 / DSM 43833 / CBS 139.67 / JCM 10125 / KCTC 9307 / NBRC 14880 / R51) TaxID=469371 RepID=D6Y6W4_THEBD|nr:hypothetical protein [Thermobispora bispora]MBO2474781.1 hypothetical protein [Actinomycetales bacterium]MDI9579724.1 hypothetical protein [Thermobispora sp.]ADG89605.1 hypothetical protein Tbis_2906 [Thermobispora bispora DSM 43833]MBX6166768.1 hypothetical protein [Thermobispora bispora]QSI49224.1 hypothetical protein CYL17_16300 [Thermobispora bispora]
MTSSSVAGRPGTVTAAAAIVAAQGLFTLVMAGYVLVETFIGTPADLVSSIALAGFGLATGAALLWVAWGLWRTDRWSRGPAVVIQLFVLPVAIMLIRAEQYAYGVPLALAAVSAFVLLLAPSSTRALIGEDEPPGAPGSSRR